MVDSAPIAVVGAGPVGTLLAAALLHNEDCFTWVVRNPLRRAQLEQELSVQFPDGGTEYGLERTHVIADISLLPPGSCCILCVKAQHVSAVVEELQSCKPAEIVVVANGLHEGQFCLGLLYGGAFLLSGTLVTNMDNRLKYGYLVERKQSYYDFEERLTAPFLATELCVTIKNMMWHKLVLNCTINPLTALFDCDNGDVLGKLHGPLVQGLMRECQAVMRQALQDETVPSQTELMQDLKTLLQKTRDNSTSMREDLRHGRETEITMLNLALARKGAEYGLDCPLNEAVSAMISLLSKLA